MGEIADMIMDGTLCAGCGEYLERGWGDGFPRYCRGCAPKETSEKVACPICGRKVKAVGLEQHKRDTHGKPEDSLRWRPK